MVVMQFFNLSISNLSVSQSMSVSVGKEEERGERNIHTSVLACERRRVLHLPVHTTQLHRLQRARA